MEKYLIGGLEPDGSEREKLNIDGTEYVLTDKFKTMLRDSFIDWGTFLEVYHDNLDYEIMFDQVSKLLNIKENENLRDVMLPLVKKIYYLPADAHIACLMKQFMIYEPMSIAIHSLFNTIKHHFEFIVEKFIMARNMYIEQHNLKVKINDWDKLINQWNDANVQYKLESSSIILLFLNPPKAMKSGIHYKIPGKESLIDELKVEIEKFHYQGFCLNVPHQRLISLLKFPINTFVRVIRGLDPEAKFPNYDHIEKKLILDVLKNKPAKPVVTDTFPREQPPKELTDPIKDKDSEGAHDAKLKLVQWYVTKTLELRKKMLQYGKQFEQYYIDTAKLINKINDIIKNELNK